MTYLTGSLARELVERIKDGRGVVWARMRSGRLFHAKFENRSQAALCGAMPSDGTYSGWISDNAQRPERRVCADCAANYDEAAEAAK